MTKTTRAARLETLLRDALHPLELQVQDDSARHAGHAGASAAGETHFSVRIVSDKFASLSRVARSRLVNTILEGEFTDGLHALSLHLRAPGENQS